MQIETLRLDWHTAFAGAIQAELMDYADALEFDFEHRLTAEPLRIDCIIIKKAKDVIIKKNIAAIFKEWNLFEYKGPDDYISVSDFYKVHSYLYLYISQEDIPINGITVTFVESHYPETLIAHLTEERGYQVEETGPGIYTVKGDALPIQIIDNARLPEEENLWLRSLSNRIGVPSYLKMGGEIKRMDKRMVNDLRPYMYMVTERNQESAKEAIRMKESGLAILKVLRDAGLSGKTIEEMEHILGLTK